MNTKFIIIGISILLIAGLVLILGHNHEHQLNVTLTDSQKVLSNLGNNNTGFFSGILAPNSNLTQGKIHVIVLYKDRITSLHTSKINALHGTVKKNWKIIHGLSTDLSKVDIDTLKKDPTVLAVEQDLPVYALDTTSDQQVRADQVWSAGNVGGDSSSRISVAILDTGIDNNHPEFAGRIVLCHSEITNTNTCQDQNGHGTHVAGIIGATGVNPNAKGIAPGVSYEIDQVLDSTGSGSFSDVISGIDWAVANHAKIISMSLGSSPLVTTQPNCDSQSIALTDAINNAVNAGVTVVAAAGNSGTSGVGSPGCMSNVIAVGAVNNANTIASFSSQGGPLADHGITAPGVSIFSPVPNGSCQLCDSSGYKTLSGTSMATPQVSGVIALMLKANSSLTPTLIKNILFSTACNPSTSPACSTGAIPNNIYGHGRIDALRSYNAVATSIPTVTDLTSSINPSIFGGVVTFTAIASSGAGNPTGTMTFTIDGLTQAPIVLSSTGSSITLSNLSIGNHTLSVKYSGDNKYTSSSSILTQIVNTQPSVITATNGQTITINPTNVGFVASAIIKPDGTKLIGSWTTSDWNNFPAGNYQRANPSTFTGLALFSTAATNTLSDVNTFLGISNYQPSTITATNGQTITINPTNVGFVASAIIKPDGTKLIGSWTTSDWNNFPAGNYQRANPSTFTGLALFSTAATNTLSDVNTFLNG